jgi:hypothetical protein
MFIRQQNNLMPSPSSATFCTAIANQRKQSTITVYIYIRNENEKTPLNGQVTTCYLSRHELQ